MPNTNNEFKHNIRLQLSDVQELLQYLKTETPEDKERAIAKLEKMQSILLETLQD